MLGSEQFGPRCGFIAKDNKDVEYVVPKEGTIWADTLAIPKGAKHKELAEKFMNYLLDEKVSVKNYESIGYSNPNEKLILFIVKNTVIIT